MSKRQFAATVGAYLTGWLIARATFERIWQHYMTNSQDRARQKYIEDQASAIVTELELRSDEFGRYREEMRARIARLTEELRSARIAAAAREQMQRHEPPDLDVAE